MTEQELVKATKLTSAELAQLRAYVDWAEEEGCYYGTKKHFDNRHQRIREFLNMSDMTQPNDLT